MITAFALARFKCPPTYLLLIAATLQTAGTALMSTWSGTGSHVVPRQYGFEIITGVGVGLTIGATVLTMPLVTQSRDLGKQLSSFKSRANKKKKGDGFC